MIDVTLFEPSKANARPMMDDVAILCIGGADADDQRPLGWPLRFTFCGPDALARAQRIADAINNPATLAEREEEEADQFETEDMS